MEYRGRRRRNADNNLFVKTTTTRTGLLDFLLLTEQSLKSYSFNVETAQGGEDNDGMQQYRYSVPLLYEKNNPPQQNLTG